MLLIIGVIFAAKMNLVKGVYLLIIINLVLYLSNLITLNIGFKLFLEKLLHIVIRFLIIFHGLVKLPMSFSYREVPRPLVTHKIFLKPLLLILILVLVLRFVLVNIST